MKYDLVDGTGYVIFGIIAFYFVVFLLWSLIENALAGEFIVERQLSIKNILSAIGRGLTIPGLVTLGGLVGAGLLYVFQDADCDRQYMYCNYTEFSTIFIVVVLFIQAVILLLIALAVIAAAGYSAYRFVLRPLGWGLAYLYHEIRPMIPIRW